MMPCCEFKTGYLQVIEYYCLLCGGKMVELTNYDLCMECGYRVNTESIVYCSDLSIYGVKCDRTNALL